MWTPRSLKIAFESFDYGGRGSLALSDAALLLKSLGFGDVMQEELAALCKAMDHNCNGFITYEDVEAAVIRQASPPNAPEEVWRSFKLFDEGGHGRVSYQNIRARARAVIPDNDLRLAFDSFAVHGEVHYDTWKKMMSAK